MTAYDADLELAQRLADAADAITALRYGAGDLVIDTKPDLTPVTDADRAVETALREALAAERPADAVFGEEFGDASAAATAAATARRRWVIDPIDGTKNFVRRVPVWATLIGLLDGDEAVVGVVSAPALGRRWWAARGAGAWITEFGGEARRLAVSRVGRLADASLSFSAVEEWSAAGRGDAFVALCDAVWRTRAYGDFWSYLLLAEGAVDIAAEPELALWDMAALAPIVTEAGGRFTGLDGVDGVHQGSAAASNGLLHDDLLAALAGPPSVVAAAAEADPPSVVAQPMIAVRDVVRSSAWYQQVLGAVSGHGGPEYEQLLVGPQIVLQLHRLEVGHHHGTIGDPDRPVGNGVALWFELTDFDGAVARVRTSGARIETDVHVNPNAGHREIWLRDPDDYLVVLADPYS